VQNRIKWLWMGYRNAILELFGTHSRPNFARMQSNFAWRVAYKLRFGVPNGAIRGSLVPILGFFSESLPSKVAFVPRFLYFPNSKLSACCVAMRMHAFYYIW